MPTTSRTFAMSTTTIGALLLRDRPPGALIVVAGWLTSCAYCGRAMGEDDRSRIVFDHVIPRGFSGYSPRPENVVVACQCCNILKADCGVDYFGAAAVEEVARRASTYIGLRGGPAARELRAVGRELGDHLYPWAAERRVEWVRRSAERRRAAKLVREQAIRDGLGGVGFPFGALQEKACNLSQSAQDT